MLYDSDCIATYKSNSDFSDKKIDEKSNFTTTAYIFDLKHMDNFHSSSCNFDDKQNVTLPKILIFMINIFLQWKIN